MKNIVAAFIFCLFVVTADMANGQDRLPPIPPDKLTADQKKAVQEFIAARNAQPSGPFIAMLRSPEVMTRARAMGDFLRYRSSLPPRLSEFVILMTARQWTQQYEWNTHYDIAIKAGVKVEVAKQNRKDCSACCCCDLCHHHHPRPRRSRHQCGSPWVP